MSPTIPRAAAGLGLGLLALGTAACSSSAPDRGSVSASASAGASSAASAPKATEIVTKAKANALGASTGAFSGYLQQNGERMNIDFKGTNDGSTSDIRIDFGAKGAMRLVSVAGVVYMQADPVFWKAQGAPKEIQNAGDRFIKAPASASGKVKPFTIGRFLGSAFDAVAPGKISPTVGEESVGGRDCWVIVDKAGAQEGSLYVAKDTYQVVRFTGSRSQPGQIDFSRWNEDLGIRAPSADQLLVLG